MRPSTRALALAVLAGTAWAAPPVGGMAAVAEAAPAPAPPTFAERVDVHVVNLEVFVTDAGGRPVADLKPADFRVFEDGRQVALQNFSWVEGGRGQGGQPGAPGKVEAGPALSPLYLVVVLDEEHLRTPNRQALFVRLAYLLTERLPAGSQVMIWRYEGTLQALQPFTTDRRELLAALSGAATTVSPRQLGGESEWLSTLDALQQDAVQGPCLFGDAIARTYADQRRDEVRHDLRVLDRLVGTLEGLPGRKVMLYVGDGIPLRPGEEAWARFLELCGGDAAALGQPGSKDVSTFSAAERAMRSDPQKLRLEALSYDTSKEWEKLAARANGEGVSLYSMITGSPDALSSPIQLAGPGPSALVLGGAESNRLDAAFFLASETGGRLVYDGPGTEKALAGIGEDASYYLLGYPAPDARTGRIRRLRVEVSRAGLRVRHRRSYTLKTDDEQASDRLLSRLYYGVGDNPLGLKLQPAAQAAPAAAAAKDGSKSTRLQLAVPLRGLTLLAQPGQPNVLQGMISVYVVANGSGGATEVRRRLLPLRLPAGEAGAARQRDYVYEVAMPLARGRNEVAVAVRDELTGEMSFTGEAVTVPR